MIQMRKGGLEKGERTEVVKGGNSIAQGMRHFIIPARGNGRSEGLRGAS